MDKASNISSVSSSNISINDRKSILITGVKKIDSFNDEEFLLETSLGYMIVQGENLEIVKLDTYQGNVNIKGTFNSLSYLHEGTKKRKEASVISRLFK
jgi:sporulation protein YabP